MKNTYFFYPETEDNQPRKVVAGIHDTDTNTIIIGKSECSVKDRFNKAKGRAIALGRANCNRDLKPKEFIQKGIVIRSNKDLLPKQFTIDSSTPIMHQFIELAKSI